MKVIKNPNKEEYEEILADIRANNGYCPCVMTQSENTKCPCKKFREEKECICGLYIKID